MTRTWRGGLGDDNSARMTFVDSRPDRYTFTNDVDWECSHPYCDVVVLTGELIYRSRNRTDAWYCSKVCRERHVRILVQERRRAGVDTRKQDRDMRLRRKYGISADEFERMYSEQLGRCAICHRPLTEGKGTSVDHDHSCCSGSTSCGRCVRGLLCTPCNIGIGGLQDDVEVLRSAITYIESHQERVRGAVSVDVAQEVM